MGLSTIIGCIALVPATLAVVLRPFVPLPITLTLAHIAATGVVVATSASGSFCDRSTPLLGKDRNGSIHPVSLIVWWPYHLGLRTKLYIQRRVSSEPLYNKILPGL